MTNTNQHGGPRPATRPDDGRHRNPGGPGRLPKSFTLKLGDNFAKQQADVDGNGVGTTELWTVEEITRTYVKLRCDNGDYVRLIR